MLLLCIVSGGNFPGSWGKLDSMYHDEYYGSFFIVFFNSFLFKYTLQRGLAAVVFLALQQLHYLNESCVYFKGVLAPSLCLLCHHCGQAAACWG